MILNMLIKTCLIVLTLKRRDSLYYASYEEDIKKLEKELYYLHKHDFKAAWLSEKQIGQRYPFKNVQLFIRIMMVK